MNTTEDAVSLGLRTVGETLQSVRARSQSQACGGLWRMRLTSVLIFDSSSCWPQKIPNIEGINRNQAIDFR